MTPAHPRILQPAGIHFIQKPYTAADLVRRIRSVLDGPEVQEK